MEIKYGITYRRFPYVTFTDLYNAPCSLQLSSREGLDAVWFGVDDGDPSIMARDANRLGLTHLLSDGPERLNGWVKYPLPEEVQLTTRMHLSREQVKALLPILQYFVDTGIFPSQEQVETMQK